MDERLRDAERTWLSGGSLEDYLHTRRLAGETSEALLALKLKELDDFCKKVIMIEALHQGFPESCFWLREGEELTLGEVVYLPSFYISLANHSPRNFLMLSEDGLKMHAPLHQKIPDTVVQSPLENGYVENFEKILEAVRIRRHITYTPCDSGHQANFAVIEEE